MWDLLRMFGIPILFGFLLWQALRDQGVSWFRKSFLRSTSPIGYWATVALYTGFLVYFVHRAVVWSFNEADTCIPDAETGTVCTFTLYSPAEEPAT